MPCAAAAAVAVGTAASSNAAPNPRVIGDRHFVLLANQQDKAVISSRWRRHEANCRALYAGRGWVEPGAAWRGVARRGVARRAAAIRPCLPTPRLSRSGRRTAAVKDPDENPNRSAATRAKRGAESITYVAAARQTLGRPGRLSAPFATLLTPDNPTAATAAAAAAAAATRHCCRAAGRVKPQRPAAAAAADPAAAELTMFFDLKGTSLEYPSEMMFGEPVECPVDLIPMAVGPAAGGGTEACADRTWNEKFQGSTTPIFRVYSKIFKIFHIFQQN